MKKQHVRSALAGLLCVLLLLLCAGSAFAGGLELTRPCSVTFRVVSFYQPVPGGNIKLVKVASFDGSRYTWIPALASFPLQPTEVDTLTECAALYALVQQKDLPAMERTVDQKGEATFSNLEPGLYLYYQTVPAPGFTVFPPFVLSLPLLEDGRWNYAPTIYPKPGLPEPSTSPGTPTSPSTPTAPTSPTSPASPTNPTNPTSPTNPTNPTNPTSPTVPTGTTAPTEPGTTAPTKPTAPDTPTSPTEPGEPTSPEEPTKPTKPTKPGEDTTAPDHSKTEPRTTTEKPEELPKTGQLKWPVPVLAGAGLLLLALGALLRLLDRREEDTP